MSSAEADGWIRRRVEPATSRQSTTAIARTHFCTIERATNCYLNDALDVGLKLRGPWLTHAIPSIIPCNIWNFWRARRDGCLNRFAFWTSKGMTQGLEGTTST